MYIFVCEISTHLDGAGVFTVPTPPPLFQSWPKDAPQQLTKRVFISQTDCTHLARVREH